MIYIVTKPYNDAGDTVVATFTDFNTAKKLAEIVNGEVHENVLNTACETVEAISNGLTLYTLSLNIKTMEIYNVMKVDHLIYIEYKGLDFRDHNVYNGYYTHTVYAESEEDAIADAFETYERIYGRNK